MTKQERLRKLYEENHLEQEDTFIMKVGGRNIPMILRSGIEKIQANKAIRAEFETVYCNPPTVVIKCKAWMGPMWVETYAEANEKNCKNSYPVMTCEKRALGRAVLKLAGFYKEGVFAEGENLEADNE